MTNNTNCANFDRYHDINLVNRYGETEAGIKVVLEDKSIYVFDMARFTGSLSRSTPPPCAR